MVERSVGLLDLPDELIKEIMDRCHINDQINLSRVCRRFHRIYRPTLVFGDKYLTINPERVIPIERISRIKLYRYNRLIFTRVVEFTRRFKQSIDRNRYNYTGRYVRIVAIERCPLSYRMVFKMRKAFTSALEYHFESCYHDHKVAIVRPSSLDMDKCKFAPLRVLRLSYPFEADRFNYILDFLITPGITDVQLRLDKNLPGYESLGYIDRKIRKSREYCKELEQMGVKFDYVSRQLLLDDIEFKEKLGVYMFCGVKVGEFKENLCASDLF